jgi:PASTA domain
MCVSYVLSGSVWTAQTGDVAMKRHNVGLVILLIAVAFGMGCPPSSPRVPNLAGLTQVDAEQAIVDAGFVVGAVDRTFNDTVPDGQVAGQTPSAGAAANSGTAVGFVISLGEGPEPTTIVSRAVQVTLPQKTSLSDLGIATSLGTHSVDGNGEANVDTLASGPHLAIVTSPNGNAMLMGWLDDDNQILSAHTTAEVLMYWASGAFALTPDAQAEAISMLREEDLTSLTAAIAASVAADPDSMAADNPAVHAALQAAMDAYMTAGKSTLITPSASRSGIQIEQTKSANTIRLTNMYRRSAHAWLERVSYTPTGGSPVSDPAALMEFSVDPVTGLGSLVETLGDIILGNLAYEYVNTQEVRLPVVDGASKTAFKLTVVGMGVGSGDWNRLTTDQQWKQREVAVWFVAKDLVWPIAMDIALPAYSTATNGFYHEFLTYDQPRPALLAEWVETIDNLSGFPEAVAAGDVTEATGIALKAMAENGRVQDLTTDILFLLVLKTAQGIDPAGAASGASDAFALAQQIMVAARIVDVLLASFDVGRVAKDLANSNIADVWDIEVTPPDVRLTPQTSTISSIGEVTLTASVPSASGSVGEDPVYAYHWKNTGTCGHLSDGVGHHGQEFDSSADHVLYSADSVEGTDTVTVDVYQVPLDGGQRILLGTATATVTAEFTNYIEHQGTFVVVDSVKVTDHELDPSNGPPSSNWLAYGHGWVWPEPPSGYVRVTTVQPDGAEYDSSPPIDHFWKDYQGFDNHSTFDPFDLRHQFFGGVSHQQPTRVNIGAMNLNMWSTEEAAIERIQLKRDTAYGTGEYEGWWGKCKIRYYYQ